MAQSWLKLGVGCLCATLAYRQWLSRRRWIARICIGLGALSGPGTHAEEMNDVMLAFLKLHRVPCRAVINVGTVVLDEVATCEDGREWMLFWLENEVAFVHPETRELYKWQWELNALYPQLYNVHERRGDIVSVGNGR
jgi:hypothetical protein